MGKEGQPVYSVVVDELADELQRELALIEDALMDAATGDTPYVTEAAQHIISAGGKRFRPMLVCLASRFGGAVDTDDLVRAALTVELTHVASLYHDDVMDEADLRRGAPSANSRWGNSMAIMIGDLLFARASAKVAELGVAFVGAQASTFARLVQGQIAETRGPEHGEDPLEHYLRVVADKTGSLIATSALFGAMVADASPEVIEALVAFGEEIGVVFQLSDDLIDITSDNTGKTPGTDLREGVPTLPILMLKASTDPADDAVKALVSGDLSDDEALAEALRWLRAHRVIAEARAVVRARADVARGYLAPLPDGAAKAALLKVCDELVDRVA